MQNNLKTGITARQQHGLAEGGVFSQMSSDVFGIALPTVLSPPIYNEVDVTLSGRN